MLDIIVTHYKEPMEVGEKLFKMIDLQRCIDFNDIHVTVINDGGNRLPEDFFGSLRYPVRQIDIPHGGISAARNAGIEMATEPWIMFCDFDDCFANIYALRDILSVLPSAEADLLWTRLLNEDYREGNEYIYIVPDIRKFVFVHGKVYRRQFLIDENIRFETDLHYNEDSCFNDYIIAKTPYWRIAEIRTKFPLYVWIRRQGSLTTSGQEDEMEYGHFRKNFIITEANKNDPENYAGMVTRTVFDTYYMLHVGNISLKMKRRMLEEFIPWISERISVYGRVDKDMIEQIRQISMSELKKRDIPDDFETVSEWVHGVVRRDTDGQNLYPKP